MIPCPHCGRAKRHKLIRTTPRRSDKRVYRIRECKKCRKRFRTFEQLDPKQDAEIDWYARKLTTPAKGANHPGRPRKDSSVTLAELPEGKAELKKQREQEEQRERDRMEWINRVKRKLPDLKV
jgi:hypothetical protein